MLKGLFTSLVTLSLTIGVTATNAATQKQKLRFDTSPEQVTFSFNVFDEMGQFTNISHLNPAGEYFLECWSAPDSDVVSIDIDAQNRQRHHFGGTGRHGVIQVNYIKPKVDFFDPNSAMVGISLQSEYAVGHCVFGEI